MLARQMSADLQAIRDSIRPGEAKLLVSKGISFGTLARDRGGNWVTTGVLGLQASSVAGNPPNLLIRPFHQAGAVISLRQFTNNAMNHHHGIQPTERFGVDTDPDGDGVTNELTEADVTAVTVFQATMSVPGRVIPNDPLVEAAIRTGEQRFLQIGCATCHIPKLPLDNNGWVFTEPNPYNPSGNRTRDAGQIFSVDLTSSQLPPPRLKPQAGVVWVPAFTDLKLHDICDGFDDPNIEPLDMHAPAGSAAFFCGKPTICDTEAVGQCERAAVLPPRSVHNAPRGDPGPWWRSGRHSSGIQCAAACRPRRDRRVPEIAIGAAARHSDTCCRRSRQATDVELHFLMFWACGERR